MNHANKERPRRSEVVRLRVHSREAALIRAAARVEGRTVSEVLREVALAAARRVLAGAAGEGR